MFLSRERRLSGRRPIAYCILGLTWHYVISRYSEDFATRSDLISHNQCTIHAHYYIILFEFENYSCRFAFFGSPEDMSEFLRHSHVGFNSPAPPSSGPWRPKPSVLPTNHLGRLAVPA